MFRRNCSLLLVFSSLVVLSACSPGAVEYESTEPSTDPGTDQATMTPLVAEGEDEELAESTQPSAGSASPLLGEVGVFGVASFDNATWD